MAGVKLEKICKRYPNGFEASKSLDLDIADGEFISLVGPSGCGKTTTLRMIAGLEDPTSGDLFIGGKRVNNVEPKNRGIAMVFQSYALFPHMSVGENMGFGLKIKKTPRDTIREKVEWAAELLDLKGLLDRKPRQLSGGQRQRVALGRALVLDPEVLLLDEPLSNLDAKLRIKMRTELKRIHRHLRSTIVYVTHDQAEAMTLSDRIAIMNKGKLVQIGAPLEIYNHPNSQFVASFIGSPSMNFVHGRAEKEDGHWLFRHGVDETIRIPAEATDAQALLERCGAGGYVLGFRPEDVEARETTDGCDIVGNSSVLETLGSDDYLAVEAKSGQLLNARVPAQRGFPLDVPVGLTIRKERLHIFENQGEEMSFRGVAIGKMPAKA